MSPQVFFGLLIVFLLAAVLYAFEDEILHAVADPATQVELGRNLGVTKEGHARPGD